MHRTASNVRRRVAELLNQLESAYLQAVPTKPYRVLMSRYQLDVLRALFDKPRLPWATSPRPIERDPYFNTDEPIVIERAPYFYEREKLFFDVTIDMRSQAGLQMICPFSGLDLTDLRLQWSQFLDACPRGAERAKIGIPRAEDLDCDKQKDLYRKFVELKIDEPHIAEALVRKVE